MGNRVLRQLEERGYPARVVDVVRLHQLRSEYDVHWREGRVDSGLYHRYLSGFVFEPPESLLQARSLLVATSRQPQIRFTFTWRDERVALVVPPTYLHARRTDGQVEQALTEILQPEGYRVVPARVPKKLLAVRSGLAEYGRNNVTYVDGLGSFHRLVVLWSDLPSDGEQWREPVSMARCGDCQACRRACPTGAIAPDRFLLRAERCIVYHNEEPADVPFPAWMDPAWHNCLVGCMLCQQVCPANEPVLGWVEDGAAFSEEETALLVEGVGLDRLPSETADKVKKSDLACLLAELPRNLRVLLER